jgi:hypothetical protein
MEKMEKYLFMRSLLQWLSQAALFNRAIAVGLRAAAAVIVLFSLATFFQAGKVIFDLPAQSVAGGVLFEVFFVLAVYAAVHVLILRARDVDELKPNEFYALPVAALVVRLLGEAYAAFVSLVAVGGGLFVWFTGMSVTRVLNPMIRALFPKLKDEVSFMGGIEFMVFGILTALGALILSYVLFEILVLVSRYANREASHAAREHGGTNGSYRSRFGS